jgi:alkanesulfonate monooxygenase SsuD/methylene tetrahydromethanopterin reductase-like flavin-dependent oxidoreductase (luciferase family)
VRVGVVILPETRWRDAEPMWRRAEALGFAHAWTYDHISWGPLRDSAWFGAVPTLAAAAVATTSIRIGTLVASPNFRHPVPFARELITLDDLAAGRFTLGIGAGGLGWDATILGQDPWSPVERADRFAEFVGLIDQLLRGPVTTAAGHFYAAEAVRNHPGCVQEPRLPFAIAATGPRGMRLAAEHGAAWVTNGDRAHEGAPLNAADGSRVVREQLHQLDEACATVGRDPSTLDRIVQTGTRLDPGLGSPAMFDDTKGAYAEVGVTDLVVHWPRRTEPYRGDASILERIAISDP